MAAELRGRRSTAGTRRSDHNVRMGLRYDVVDVFTDRPYAGNPLAVVHGGAELTAAQMQAIAAEFGLSETAFPLPPTAPGADYRLRIFTPARELPFAGHPSVGAAWVLARDRVIGTGEVVQECGAGLLPVTVDEHGAQVAGGPPELGPDLDGPALAAAVGLAAADLDPAVPAGVAAAGVPFAFLPVRPDAVARAATRLRRRWRGAHRRPGRAGRVRLRPRGLAGAPAHVRPGRRRVRGPGDRLGGGGAGGVPAGRGVLAPTGRPGSPSTRAPRSAGRRGSGCWSGGGRRRRDRATRCTAAVAAVARGELVALPAAAG